MKLCRLVVGSFEWRLHGRQWEFQFHPAGFVLDGGLTGLAPTNPYFRRSREIARLAAGPLANLFLGTITLWATLSAKGRFWEPAWGFLAVLSTFSLLVFLVNLVPVRPEAHYSDGARIYQLLRGGPWTDVYRALLMIASSVASPLRPRDYDIEIIQRAASFLTHGKQALMLRLHAYLYFFDCGRIPEALEALGQAESVYAQGAPSIPAELHTELIFANAFLKRDAAAARLWWERMQAGQRLQAEKSARLTAAYWKARSALGWIENRVEEARMDWERGNELAQKLPGAGAYDFDRFCLAELRQVLEASATSVLSGTL